jgi:hypothetical protein
LKPATKALGLHRIFIRGKRCKFVLADGTLEPMQVDAWVCWLDANEHHLGLALRADGPLKCNRWNGGRLALRWAHDAFPRIGGSVTLSITGYVWEAEVMRELCAGGVSNAS